MSEKFDASKYMDVITIEEVYKLAEFEGNEKLLRRKNK